jgi:hypothetical protein
MILQIYEYIVEIFLSRSQNIYFFISLFRRYQILLLNLHHTIYFEETKNIIYYE